jgi:hypothetical protein
MTGRNLFSGAVESASSMDGAQSGVRYLSPGTYYIEITVTGTTSGLYSLEWEERP